MNKLIFTIISFISFGFISIFSQKIIEPDKISISDFSVEGKKSVYLWYKSVITFPYSYSDKTCGALDRYFGLKNETYTRILLNHNDTSLNFLAVDKFYNTIPEITSVICYYINTNNFISSRTGEKDSVLIIYYFEKGYFLDLSSFKNKDANVIVDLQFTYSIKSKKEVYLFLDNKMDYRYITIRLEIPEIYSYKIDLIRKELSSEPGRPYFGPTIGWMGTINYNSATIRFFYHDSFNFNNTATSPDGIVHKLENPRIYPVKCLVKPFIFKSKGYIFAECSYKNDKLPVILSLKLTDINEIWPDGVRQLPFK